MQQHTASNTEPGIRSRTASENATAAHSAAESKHQRTQRAPVLTSTRSKSLRFCSASFMSAQCSTHGARDTSLWRQRGNTQTGAWFSGKQNGTSAVQTRASLDSARTGKRAGKRAHTPTKHVPAEAKSIHRREERRRSKRSKLTWHAATRTGTPAIVEATLVAPVRMSTAAQPPSLPVRLIRASPCRAKTSTMRPVSAPKSQQLRQRARD